MNCKLCGYYTISFILAITALICLFVPPSMFFKTMADKMYSNEDLQQIKTRTVDLSTAKHLALKTEKNYEHISNPKLKFAISFCLYFIEILSNYSQKLSGYFEIISIYLTNQNVFLQFILPLTSFAIFHLIIYGCLFSFSGIIASFNDTFVKCRLFCERFGWYFAAFALFNIFIPMIPCELVYIIYAILGCPIHCMLFALFVSHLPEFYIHLNLSSHFIQLETLKFHADYYYLLTILIALGSMLFVCVVKTLHLYFEKNDEDVKVTIDNKNSDDKPKKE